MKKIMSGLVALLLAIGLGVGVQSMQSTASAGTGTATGTVQGALVPIDVDSPRGIYIDANGIPHCLPSGPNAKSGQSGDYRGMWFSGANPLCTFGGATAAAPVAASDPVKIVHKTVTVDADYQAGTKAERTVTFTGLPAYVSSGSAEVWGDNSGGVPDSFGTPAKPATIKVTRTAPTNGQTTRSFTVSAEEFTGSESYTLDVWVLVTV